MVACVLTALLSAACASVPPSPGERPANDASADREHRPVRKHLQAPERLRLKIDAEAPFLPGDDDDKALASDFSIGIDDVLSYRASWSFEPGDVIAGGSSPEIGRAHV